MGEPGYSAGTPIHYRMTNPTGIQMSARLIKALLADKRRSRAYRKLPLSALKRRALAHSRSSVVGADAESFGFVPAGSKVEVLSWPKL